MDEFVFEDRGYRTPCRVWQRARTKAGYGNRRQGRRVRYVHVLEWEQVHGPIPAGKQIDHLCRVRECGEVSHMELVTGPENTRRGRSAKLSAVVVAEIRELLAGGANQSELARRHGVTPATVWKVAQGRTWVVALTAAVLLAGCSSGSVTSTVTTTSSSATYTSPGTWPAGTVTIPGPVEARRACVHYIYVTGSDGRRHRRPCPTPSVQPPTSTSGTSSTPSPAPVPVATTGPQPSSCDFASGAGCSPVPTSCRFRYDGVTPLPDARCTPGALNAAVTPSTVGSTICVHGYTATIRPPVSYTGALKLKLMAAYGLTGSPSLYELDHLVPLEGGGAAADPGNLWPQPYAPTPGAHQKDSEENFLKAEACGGKAALLPNLQAAIASDWLAAFQADNPPPATFGHP